MEHFVVWPETSSPKGDREPCRIIHELECPRPLYQQGSDPASSVFYVVEYPRARPSKRRQREQWSRIGARPAKLNTPMTIVLRNSVVASTRTHKKSRQ